MNTRALGREAHGSVARRAQSRRRRSAEFAVSDPATPAGAAACAANRAHRLQERGGPGGQSGGMPPESGAIRAEYCGRVRRRQGSRTSLPTPRSTVALLRKALKGIAPRVGRPQDAARRSGVDCDRRVFCSPAALRASDEHERGVEPRVCVSNGAEHEPPLPRLRRAKRLGRCRRAMREREMVRAMRPCSRAAANPRANVLAAFRARESERAAARRDARPARNWWSFTLAHLTEFDTLAKDECANVDAG